MQKVDYSFLTKKIESKKLKPGEERFIKKIETHPKAPEVLKKTPQEVKQFIKERIEEIKKEISEIPLIQQDIRSHPDEETKVDLLARGFDLVINNDIEQGLKFIMQTNDAHLIDLFHDILVGYFLEKLIKLGKIKPQEISSDSLKVNGSAKILKIILIIIILMILIVLGFSFIKFLNLL